MHVRFSSHRIVLILTLILALFSAYDPVSILRLSSHLDVCLQHACSHQAYRMLAVSMRRFVPHKLRSFAT